MNSLNKMYCPICEKGLIRYIPPIKEALRVVGNVDNLKVVEKRYSFECTECSKKWKDGKITTDEKGNVIKFELID